MKKFLLSAAVIIVVTMIAAYIFRQPLMMALVGSQIKPEQVFSPDSVPAAPDYSADQSWAS
ncbi:MAG: hypothetical protein V2I41_05680, partial [Pseudomonadales bacterium]|nr:hypothetical protein [Pseudomonadales bacterium]